MAKHLSDGTKAYFVCKVALGKLENYLFYARSKKKRKNGLC